MPTSAPLPSDPIAESHRLWTEHGWGAAADGMAAVTSVMRAQQILLARCDEVLRPLGLTFARYEVLMVLLFSRREALPMGIVGSRLQVHPTSATSAVRRLVAAGLVQRRPDETDGRAVLVGLTDQGRATAERATDLLNGRVFADPGIPERRVRTLVGVLRDLRRTAGDFAPGAR